MGLSQNLMQRGMKLMSDPRVMKWMSNPKVMNVVMQAFQLGGKAQVAFEAQVKTLARSLKLATRDDLRELKTTVRSLEQTLQKIQNRIERPIPPPAT